MNYPTHNVNSSCAPLFGCTYFCCKIRKCWRYFDRVLLCLPRLWLLYLCSSTATSTRSLPSFQFSVRIRLSGIQMKLAKKSLSPFCGFLQSGYCKGYFFIEWQLSYLAKYIETAFFPIPISLSPSLSYSLSLSIYLYLPLAHSFCLSFSVYLWYKHK